MNASEWYLVRFELFACTLLNCMPESSSTTHHTQRKTLALKRADTCSVSVRWLAFRMRSLSRNSFPRTLSNVSSLVTHTARVQAILASAVACTSHFLIAGSGVWAAPLPSIHSHTTHTHTQSERMKPSAFREHDDSDVDADLLQKEHLPVTMASVEQAGLSRGSLLLLALSKSSAVRKYAIQGVFLFTGVFSTCAAQYVFYQGAGGTVRFAIIIVGRMPCIARVLITLMLMLLLYAWRLTQTRRRCCCRCATTSASCSSASSP